METITGIILLVVGVLQIMLFFKVWGMCNNTKRLYNSVKRGSNNLLVQANIHYLEGDMEKTKECLIDSFRHELAVARANYIGYEKWRDEVVNTIGRYRPMFEKLDIPIPDLDKYKNWKAYL